MTPRQRMWPQVSCCGRCCRSRHGATTTTTDTNTITTTTTTTTTAYMHTAVLVLFGIITFISCSEGASVALHQRAHTPSHLQPEGREDGRLLWEAAGAGSVISQTRLQLSSRSSSGGGSSSSSSGGGGGSGGGDGGGSGSVDRKMQSEAAEERAGNRWRPTVARRRQLLSEHQELIPPRTSLAVFPNSFIRYSTARLQTSPVPSVDWRIGGFVAPVQDQGSNCSSSWAFAVTSAIETVNAIRNGANSLVLLSVQQLLECQNGNGCEGGWPEAALAYVVANKGLNTAANYVYLGTSTRICNFFKESQRNTTIAGYERLPAQDETALQLALQSQTVIAYVAADSEAFQSYSGGIFSDATCGTVPNHAVVVVGFGTNQTTQQKFWIIRNSWGEEWGEGGYMRLARTGNGDGMCGILSLPPVYPTLAPPSPSDNGTIGGKNPCVPNPCGAGGCVRFRQNFYRCNCLASLGLVAVTNSDGTQTCARIDRCAAFGYNPCGSGAGQCINDLLGGYRCWCNSRYVQGNLAEAGGPTCVPSASLDGARTHKVVQGEFCLSIAVRSGLTLEQFLALNPGILCNNLQVGQVVIVSEGIPPCTKWYLWQPSDVCNSVLFRYGISRQMFRTLNNNVSCDAVSADSAINATSLGPQVCVAGPGGIVTSAPGLTSRCAVVRSVNSTTGSSRSKSRSSSSGGGGGSSISSSETATTCEVVGARYGLPLSYLQSLNPWLDCSQPLPDRTNVCVGAKFRAPACGEDYRVQMWDTCWAIYQRAGLSRTVFLLLNPGLSCSRLQIGTSVCVQPA